MTIEKTIKPDNNFIISGDYNQLIPVNDNICFTKKKGKEINYIKMDEIYKQKDCHGLKLDALTYDRRSLTKCKIK